MRHPRRFGPAAVLAAILLPAALTILAATIDARDADGISLYAKNCSSCHGESGHGDGPSGLFLK